MRRRLILMISVYVALDVANAFMPGAFVFDAEACIEVVRRDSMVVPGVAVVVAPPGPRDAAVADPEPVAAVPRPDTPSVRAMHVSLARAVLAPERSGAPSEDHEPFLSGRVSGPQRPSPSLRLAGGTPWDSSATSGTSFSPGG